MKRWVLVFVILLACARSGNPADRLPATQVLLNGKILTMDRAKPEVTALAIQGETILQIGSDTQIKPYIGKNTEVIDLKGHLAIPGFIEGHGHLMSFGESLMQLKLGSAHTWDEIVTMVARAVKDARPGEWLVGRGWHQEKWDKRPDPNIEGLPFHTTLSAVSPRNPVLLKHASGHAVFVNAKALEICRISRNTPNPPGGEILRDAKGNAIGMLREAAATLAEQQFEKYRSQRPTEIIESDHRRQVKLAAEAALANGITTFQDMGSTFETLDLLKRMANEGNLPVRFYMAIDEPSERMKSRLAAYRIVGYGNGYLTIRTIGEKVLDGALGTHGGWLLEPYTDLPQSSGLNVTPIEEIRTSARLATEHDYQMAIQGIGDRAVRELLDIYQQIFKSKPAKKDWRWRIEHAQVVHPADLPRFAQLGVIPGIQGIFACSDGPWVVHRLGEARARERGYLFRDMIDSGAVVMNGADPPVEEIDPMASFHCSVTRELPDGSRFFPEQSMTREQALKSYTFNNAFAGFEEKIKGSLAPGKLADITVLSKDIMTIPPNEIRSTKVLYTIVGGKVKYRRGR